MKLSPFEEHSGDFGHQKRAFRTSYDLGQHPEQYVQLMSYLSKKWDILHNNQHASKEESTHWQPGHLFTEEGKTGGWG